MGDDGLAGGDSRSPAHGRSAQKSPYPDADGGHADHARHSTAGQSSADEAAADGDPVDSPPPTAGPKRAPLPQWWWDRTLRTRRIIALAVLVVVVGAVSGLVLSLTSSSGEPGEEQTQTVDETNQEAQTFVAGLPAIRVQQWDALAECESEGDWGKATGNGFYGGLQFTQATWLEFGGTGGPHENTREVQIMIAERVQAGQGWGAWPNCSAQLGLSG